MKRVLLATVAALFAVGCDNGNTLPNSNYGASGQPDMSGPIKVSFDMAQPQTGDMAQESCGQVVECAIGCLGQAGAGTGGAADAGLLGGLGGLSGLASCASCFTGAPPAATSEATSLFTCAFTSCLSGGTASLSDPLSLFSCLSQSCSMQLSGCEGLSLGGLGGL